MDSDDKKITQLALVTSLSDSDLFVTVVNIGTAPATKAITKANALSRTIPAFSVNKGGTDQGGCTSGASTKLTWSTEVFDTNSNFASNKFTPTVAGKYLFIVSIRLVESLGAASYFNAQLYKNGSEAARSAIPSIVSTATYPHAYGTFLVDANGSSDYFEVYVQHDSPSGNRTVYGNASDTYFQGFLAVPA